MITPEKLSTQSCEQWGPRKEMNSQFNSGEFLWQLLQGNSEYHLPVVVDQIKERFAQDGEWRGSGLDDDGPEGPCPVDEQPHRAARLAGQAVADLLCGGEFIIHSDDHIANHQTGQRAK